MAIRPDGGDEQDPDEAVELPSGAATGGARGPQSPPAIAPTSVPRPSPPPPPSRCRRQRWCRRRPSTGARRAARPAGRADDRGLGHDSPVRMLRSTRRPWQVTRRIRGNDVTAASRRCRLTTSGRGSRGPAVAPNAGDRSGRGAKRLEGALARYPVTTSAPTMGTRPTRISRPSRDSPSITASTPAAARSRTKGSVTVCHSMPRIDGRGGGASSLGPLSTRRRAASACVDPALVRRAACGHRDRAASHATGHLVRAFSRRHGRVSQRCHRRWRSRRMYCHRSIRVAGGIRRLGGAPASGHRRLCAPRAGTWPRRTSTEQWEWSRTSCATLPIISRLRSPSPAIR